MGKINTNSNAYIIAYASGLVLVVAFLLAFISQALQSTIDKNIEIDKKNQILRALNIRDLADNDAIEAKYAEVVVADQIIDANATIVKEGTNKDQDGFKAKKISKEEGLPLYVCNVNGETKYVIPMEGKGLWDMIWGYVAVNADKKQVYGAYFNHKGETAGLGAIISEYENFQKQFAGKSVKEGDTYLSVVKFGNVKNLAIECDGISGATKTCDGVSAMIGEGLNMYEAFLNK